MGVSRQPSDPGPTRAFQGRRCVASAAAPVILLLYALVFTATADAASAHFIRLSVEKGLSMSSVESIAEDRHGFLWFGTQEGLNRFDGYEFMVHQASNRPGHLQDGFIRAIVPDRRGNLWVGTRTSLQHLDVDTYRFSDSVADAGVRLNTLAVERNGRIWFGGNSGGLWTREPTAAAKAKRVVTGTLTPQSSVSAVEIDPDGKVWVAADGGLLLVIPSEAAGAAPVSSRTVLPAAGDIRDIHIQQGAVWLGRFDEPLLRLDPRTGSVTEYPQLPRFVLTIASAGDGWLWIGGKGAGVTRFHPMSGRMLEYRHEPGNEHSLAEDDVAAVHQDSGGSLWVGAWNGGLSRLNLSSQAFRTLRFTPGQPDSLPDNDVTRLAEGPDGRVWVTTRNGVLAVGDPASGSFATMPFEGNPTTIAATDSELFVGTRSGLVKLDPTSGDILPSDAALRAAGVDRAGIHGLASSGRELWIVTAGKLYRRSGNGDLHHAPLPAEGRPSSLHAQSSERLWLAFPEGLILRADVAGGALVVERAGGPNYVGRRRLSAITTHGGLVWLGTSRGLGRLNPADGRLVWVDLEDALPSRSIASILPDTEGNLWLATERGITRFDPKTGEAVHFGNVQGAQSSGYVEGGALRGDSGRFYFAGKGITVFDTRAIDEDPNPLKVVFTGLEILHRSVRPSWMDPESPLRTAIHAANEVTLGSKDAVFSVEMAAPAATDPDGVQFAHRLVGFDEEWITTGADRRVATYTRLAPGNYVLRARARAGAGRWSDSEAVLHIRILPPWWRTPAAIAFWLLLAALLVALLLRETRRRTRVRIALAEQEALRRASVTDPLTGLYNRRFLAEWLKHEVPRVLRTHEKSDGSDHESLLFIAADLDNLKTINDRFGHERGDRVISAVADLLESSARSEDLAVRLGGDEFLLVLRSADRSQASVIVERLRERAQHLGGAADPSVPCTISLGFASFPFIRHHADALTWEQTMQLADRALLHSKRRGRNSWTGYVATRMTSATAVLEHLRSAGETSPFAGIRVVEGPDKSEDRLTYSEG